MSKKAWDNFIGQINAITLKLRDSGCVDPFFRGHSNPRWALYPSIARKENKQYDEERLHAIFQSMGGHLMSNDTVCWEYLFYMQHHGLPTRLLDWTENFGAALYFAVKNNSRGAVIWILDPYSLNKITLSKDQVISSRELDNDYCDYFNIEESDVYGKFPGDLIAMIGSFKSIRMRSQRSVFTFHKNLKKPLDKLFPSVVHKVSISKEALPEAKSYLQLFGINEFTLFPDLDGLGRHIKEIEKYS